MTAFASLNRQPLTRETAEIVLADMVAASQPRQITAQQILEMSASHFGFSMRRPLRPEPAPAPRHGSTDRHVLVQGLDGLQLSGHRPEFGGRDHTTVIHAYDKISGLMKERRNVYDTVTELIVRLKSNNG